MKTRIISNELISFVMKIRKFGRMYSNTNKFDNCKLTEQQFRTFMCLKKLNKCTLKELSKSLKVSTSSLCIMLGKMYEEGYVDRETDIKDRRNTFYYLTEEGQKFLCDEIERRLGLLDKQIDKLTNEKKERLYSCVKEVEEIIEELLI